MAEYLPTKFYNRIFAVTFFDNCKTSKIQNDIWFEIDLLKKLGWLLFKVSVDWFDQNFFASGIEFSRSLVTLLLPCYHRIQPVRLHKKKHFHLFCVVCWKCVIKPKRLRQEMSKNSQTGKRFLGSHFSYSHKIHIFPFHFWVKELVSLLSTAVVTS